jgi:molybdate transport system ATP-binding protein
MSIEARFLIDYPAFRLEVDLQLPAQGVTAVFGSSGSGKTTLLRTIAGLEPRTTGRLLVNGEIWQDGRTFLPVHARSLGYVFQEASLFAHLCVQANIDYGRKRSSRGIDAKALMHIVDLLGIGTLLGRKPEQLSGGERQRVALARALAPGPRLLLMDEPLAALDLHRKREILPYLERLCAELKIPILYVSHAPDEVVRLADYLVVLDTGRVRAQGELKQVLSDISTPMGLGEDTSTMIEGRVAERDAHWHLSRIACSGASLWVRDEGYALDQRVRLRILARDVSIALNPAPEQTSVLNHLPVRVEAMSADAHPALVLVRLDMQGQSLLARITRRSLDALALVPGQSVYAQIKAVSVIA